MKVLYLESKLKNQGLKLEEEQIKKLPKKLFLVYTIQYKEPTEQIKRSLQANNITITGFQQILGCSKVNTKDPILYIGTGKFHYLNLLLLSPAIYIITEDKIKQISKQEIESIRNKRKAAHVKYLNANNIGILVSTKPGQENIKIAIKLKARLKRQGKNPYIFISNNIDTTQFENFFIDSWINIACTGLSCDNPAIINYSEIK